jgi:hypothetical protein
MPRRGWILLAALSSFAIVVMGVLAWAGLSGNAGSQRGLVVFSELDDVVVVTAADGETRVITPDDEAYFVVKVEQYPGMMRAETRDGVVVAEELFEYEDFAEAGFRISIDERGFYPTASYRDTPVPTEES